MTLRDLRENAVLSQIEVARKLGIASATISRWESGDRIPTPANLRKLAELYGLPPREVLDVARKTRQPASASA